MLTDMAAFDRSFAEEIVREITDELNEDKLEFAVDAMGDKPWMAHGFVSITQMARKNGS